MGAVGSKRETSGMFSHAMNYLNTHGGDDSLALNDDIPMENRLFYGGSPASAESLLKELKDYRLSKSARAKETVMKAVIETLGDLGIKAHGNDIDSIVKTIEEKIPNPRKGDSFVDDAKAQADICKKIAAAVNKGMKSVYGDRVGDLIDPKGPPEYVCSSVVDLIHSFSSGIHLEYLSVRESIEKVLTQMSAAHEVLKSSVAQFMSKLNENELDFDTGAEKFYEIYKKAEQEIALKIQVLSGLLKLNVMPSLEELEVAMKNETEGRDYVNSVLSIGTEDFGDSIAYAINNMGTVVSLTNIINKSLKKLDMSMEEYLNIDSLKQLDVILNRKLDEIISKNNSNHEKKDDLTSILIAVDKLKKYFVSKNKLKKMKGGNDENVSGGAITTKYKSPDQIRIAKLDKRVQAMQKSQEILYKSFVKELYGAYDELLKVINGFGPKIGTQIPIGPHVDDLIQVFQKLSKSSDLRSSHFDLALSGLKDNELSYKDQKDNFVQILRDIIRHCEQANRHHGSDYFTALKQVVNLVIEVIERFNKLAKIKFGGEIQQLQADISAVGGAIESISYDPRYVSKDSIKLDEAVGTMIYYYYIANVKSNIKNNAKEVSSYGQSYEKMLEEAIRFKREDIVKSKKEIIDKLTTYTGTEKDYFLEQLERRFTAYDNLLRVVEAVDLHLKDTTVSLVDNPDLVKGLKKTLDSSRIIAKWFNEESGSELFKAFMATTKANKAAVDAISDHADFAEHPYKHFAGKASAELGEVSTHFRSEIRKVVDESISNSVDNFQALQNIINIFILIGGPTKKSLSARQMFKYLVDFIKISAITDSIDATGVQSNITNVFDSDKLSGATLNINELIGNGLNSKDEPVAIQKEMYEYFSFVMKSITGKIFVVLGLYQLLESPTSMNEISDVRFILGGNHYESSEIIPEASELYYRIPRVLEYFRELFTSSYLFNDKHKAIAKLGVADINRILAKYSLNRSDIAEITKRKNDLNTDATTKDAGILAADVTVNAAQTAVDNKNVEITNKKRDITNKEREITDKEKEYNDKLTELKKIDDSITDKTNKKAAATARTDNAEATRLDNKLTILGNDRIRVDGEKTNLTNEITVKQRELATLQGDLNTLQGDLNTLNNTLTTETNKKQDLVDEKKVITDQRDEVAAVETILTGNESQESSITILIDPEMKFFELFSLLWDQIPIDSIKNGTYSDIDCNKLIKAINKVYQEYKGRENPVKEVIQEIIWEVNRRYGIISRTEIKKYGDLRKYRTKTVDTSSLNISNGVNMIDILPDEEDIELTGVPSDNIIMDVDISKGNVDPIIRRKYELTLQKYAVLAEFRDRVQDTFAGIKDDISDYVKNTYKNSIQHIKNDLAATRDSSEKMRIVKKLITGNHKLASINQYKFLMFHETVVVGINTLRMMISIVEGLRGALESFDATKKWEGVSKILQMLFMRCGNSSELIKVTFGTKENLLQFDFSTFRSEFESLLSDVRKYIELFRPYIPEEIIEKYVRGPALTGGARGDNNQYTFVHLESLYNELLKPSDFLNEFSLKEEEDEFKKTIYYEIKECNTKIAKLINDDATAGDHHSLALSNALFYLPDTKLTVKVIGDHSAKTAFDELCSLKVDYDKGKLTPTELDAALNSFIIYDDTYTYKNDATPSILKYFNYLIFKLTKIFYDKPLRKIYVNLLQPFISGKLSSAVSNATDESATNVFPDIFEKANFGTVCAEPNSQSILFLSNALVLRNMIYTLNNTGSQVYVSQNISEIPVYMRELYKCNLPYFVKEFDDLIKYCEFIRYFIDETKDIFDYNRKPADIGTNAEYDTKFGTQKFAGLKGIIQKDAANNPNKTASNFISYAKDMLNNFVNAATEIKETCERVYREVADEQIYLQTEPDQYSKFVSRYERNPIAPVSFNLLGVQSTNKVLTMVKDINSPEFKYNYGVRSTLLDIKEFNVSSVPFNKTLVHEFNSLVNGDDKIELSAYDEFTKKLVKNFRYITNISNMRRRFITNDPILDGKQVANVAGTANVDYNCASPVICIYDSTAKKLVDNDLKNIFDLMLSTNASASLDDFIKPITLNHSGGSSLMKTMTFKTTTVNPRNNERRYNFIDLNVLPINPSALMRDIPLTNIFNYSYTFEKMLKRFLPTNEFTSNLIYKMTIDPFRTHLPYNSTSGAVSMFNGLDSNIFGRPKFLSDQLFNKVLLGSINDKNGATFRKLSSSVPVSASVTNDTLNLQVSKLYFKSTGSSAKQIRYVVYDADKKHKIESVDLADDVSDEEVTRRFNTVIVRNMIFITNLFRIIRFKLESDLVDRKKILQPTHNLVDVNNTEFRLNDQFSNRDYQNDVINNLP